MVMSKKKKKAAYSLATCAVSKVFWSTHTAWVVVSDEGTCLKAWLLRTRSQSIQGPGFDSLVVLRGSHGFSAFPFGHATLLKQVLFKNMYECYLVLWF